MSNVKDLNDLFDNKAYFYRQEVMNDQWNVEEN